MMYTTLGQQYMSLWWDKERQQLVYSTLGKQYRDLQRGQLGQCQTNNFHLLQHRTNRTQYQLQNCLSTQCQYQFSQSTQFLPRQFLHVSWQFMATVSKFWCY